MLPRRGYEPVVEREDTDDNNCDEAINGDSSNDNTNDYNQNDTTQRSEERNASGTADVAAGGTETLGGLGLAAVEANGEITVRILDVQGETYSLSVSPGTTVHEIKNMLLETAEVEISRQRIIFGGKLLCDSDTLASRNVSDGASMHLFKKPKAAAYVADAATASPQQPGGLEEVPPLLLHIRDRGSSSQDGFLDAAWEVEAPRRGIRFLASFLLLVSIMELLECLASISAAMTLPAGGGHGHMDKMHPTLTREYWVLVRMRTLWSVIGVFVGVFGVRGSQNLNPHILRLYVCGLIVCAIIWMVIRIQVLCDVISGKISFGEYGSDGLTTSSSGDNLSSSSGDDRGGGDGWGPGEYGSHGEGAPAGSTDGGVSPRAEHSNLVISILVAFLSLMCSGGVWFVCIWRARRMHSDIEEHVYRRQLLREEMRLDQERGGPARDAAPTVTGRSETEGGDGESSSLQEA